MRVKALQKIYYDRHEYQPGESFEMDDREEMQAKLIAILGKIEIIKEEKPAPVPAAPRYATRAEKAEEPLPAIEAQLGDAPKRHYRRRDMKAEE